MNQKQKTLLLVGLIIFILIGLFPPWTFVIKGSMGHNSFNREKPAGYGFLFSPPPPENGGPIFGVRLDLSRLIVQWIMLIGVLAMALAYMAKSKASTKTRVSSDANLNEDLLKDVVQALGQGDVGYHPELDGEKYRGELKQTSDMIARSLFLRNADDEQIYFALDSLLQDRISRWGTLKNDHIESSIITWMKYHQKLRAYDKTSRES